jgi:tetratricopeptide (TPR) repeat protein
MSQTPLKAISEAPTLSQKLTGAVLARRWVASGNPPTGADKAGVYVATLTAGVSDPQYRGALARALLWSDFLARCYRPELVREYLYAAEQFPDDERCAFFTAALAAHGLLSGEDPHRDAALYRRLFREKWKTSTYWDRLEMSRSEALRALASVATERDGVAALEVLFEQCEGMENERRLVARRLAAAYRIDERDDDKVDKICRFVFVHSPDDRDNNDFLARRFLAAEREDAPAGIVYGRRLALAEAEADTKAAPIWAAALARVYIHTNRVDTEALALFRYARRFAPDDRVLEAALVYAAARSALDTDDPELITLVESTLAFEAEFIPIFFARGWDWSSVPRAVALRWGRAGRRDPLALRVIARAAELCPHDPEMIALQAHLFAAAGETSMVALRTYERAEAMQTGEEGIRQALGQAYLVNRMHLGEERRKVMRFWEGLYRDGKASKDIASILSDALMHDPELQDIAMPLWEEMARKNRKNGPLRLQIARVLRQRGEPRNATPWFLEAARLLPNDFTVLTECAYHLKEHTTDSKSVTELLSHAITLPEGRSSVEAHVLLGEALLASDRRDEAKEIFQTVIDRLDAQHTRALLHLAKLNLRYEESGVAVAEALYEQAATQDPNNPETYRRMADLYREQGQTELEQAALERYLQLSAPDASLYRKLADLYLQRSDYARAEQALRQVVFLGGADKRIYVLLGEVLQAQNQAA